MKEKTVLIIAGCLIVAGISLFALIMSMNKWNFNLFNTGRMEEQTFTLDETFHNINLDTNTADIRFLPAGDDTCKVVCYQSAREPHVATVEGDALTIRVQDHRKWYQHIGFGFRSPKLTVYLPQTQYRQLTIREDTGNIQIPGDFQFEEMALTLSTGDVTCHADVTGDMKITATTGKISVSDSSVGNLTLTASTGNITVDGISTGDMAITTTTGKIRVKDAACSGSVSLSVSTGKTELTDITCSGLSSSGSTGDLTMENVITSGKFTCKRDTGDVKLTLCDAAELYIKTDTGDVTGSLKTDKIIFAQTDTGKVSVPKTTTGGRCEIETDTGDIKITIGN